MITVTGVFDNRMDADRAITDLLNQGFSNNDFSLVMSDTARNKIFNTTDEQQNGSEARTGAKGAAIGGGLGALLAGLTAVGSLAIPGAGVLVAGPLIAALAGAGAGAAVGGIGAALVQAGINASEVSRYEKAIKAGNALLIVHARDERQADIARNILKSTEAHAIV